MALHDSYARRTPYELSLPSLQFGEERFARVAEEAEAQGFPGHLTDIRSFSLLAEVGEILREIRTPDDPPELIQQYGMLMFHAFHFWQNGFPLFLVSLDAARRAVEADGGQSLNLPSSGSAYFQLPQHLFWVGAEREESAASPESLDGVFVTWTGGDLIAMVVAGVSVQRSGVIAMPLPAVRISDLSDIVGEITREDTDDFSTSLPGAEIDGLYGVDSAGEALKLVARLLPGMDSAEAAVLRDPTDGSPTASLLPYRRMG